MKKDLQISTPSVPHSEAQVDNAHTLRTSNHLFSPSFLHNSRQPRERTAGKNSYHVVRGENVDKNLVLNIPRKRRKYRYHEIITEYYLQRTFTDQKRT